MALNLTEGAIASLMNQDPIDPPVLQVLGVRKLIHPGSTDRYRIMLSDGRHLINFAMLATQHNSKIEQGELEENCIVRLSHHITSKLNKDNRPGTTSADRRVLIILDIEVLVPGTEIGKIGDPVLFTDDPTVSQNRTDGGGTSTSVNGHGSTSIGSNNTAITRAPMLNTERPHKIARVDRPNLNYPSDIVTRPISSINPYQNKWVIRARVTAKSPVRTWSNSRGEGSLFSLDLKDETGEIRATAFKDDCERFYNVLEENKVYYITNCTVKNANKKFSTLKNDFELTFTRDTQVTLVEEDITTIPGLEYHFTPISTLATTPLDQLVDVIGVCKSFSDVNTFIARATGKELKKREVTLVDNSNASVSLTLWAEKAMDFDGTHHPIVAIRQAKLSEFGGGKSISTGMSSNLLINPNIPEAHRLRGWYDNGGADEAVVNISAGATSVGGGQEITGEVLSILEAKDRHLGMGEMPDYYNAVVSIMSVKRENVYYLSCPSPDCKKKVIDNQNGTYRCEKCQRDYEECLPRMIISMNVADWSDNMWITLFDTDAHTLLGVDGKELRRLKEDDGNGFNEVFDKVKFQEFKARMRVKAEMYNDESRLKTVVAKLELLNVVNHNREMLKEIMNMKAEGVKPEIAA